MPGAAASSFADVVDALAGVLWFLLAAVAVGVLLPELRRIVKSREFSVEIGGFKLSAQMASDQVTRHLQDLQDQVNRLSEQLPEAVATPPEPGAALPRMTLFTRFTRFTPPPAIETTEEPSAAPAPDLESFSIRDPQALHRAASKRLLWVDDHPENNALEVQAFRDAGWDVSLAHSTDEALALLSEESVDVVLSDLGRTERGAYRPNAAIDLLTAQRDAGHSAPVVVYTTADRALREGPRLLNAGVDAVTASPADLRRAVDKLLSVALERRVDELLLQAGFEPEDTAAAWGVDFVGRVGERRLAIEVVRLDTQHADRRVREAGWRLQSASGAEDEPLDHLIIVTPRPVEPDVMPVEAGVVRLMSVSELQGFLNALAR